MMRLPRFAFHAPRSVDEAADLLASRALGGAMLLAGGTDLLPNMKRRQQVPTTLDMPEVFTELVENPDPRGPFGAKEVGQGPLLPVMPAVANAVYDAIGVRIDEVPITPEKILRALDAKAAGKPPRCGPTRFPAVDWPEPLEVPPPWAGGDGRAINDAHSGRRAPGSKLKAVPS